MNMNTTLTALGLTILTMPALATSASPRASEVVARVKGIVCTFCAYGARKNLERLELDRTRFKDGIEFETKKGILRIAFRGDQPIDLAGIRQAIVKGGYELISLHLSLVGVLEVRDGATALTSRGNSQRFRLLDAQGGAWRPAEHAGREVTLKVSITDKSLAELPSPDQPVPAQVEAML